MNDDRPYPNRLVELGIAQSAVDERIQSCFQAMFRGPEGVRIYEAIGADMGEVIDTGNDDVRTEGMSYGMMMAVQMGDKDLFDRLWRWALRHMYLKEGPHSGYFAWSANRDGSLRAEGPAPDGEEYFALALFFAAHRWGDGPAPLDYSAAARRLLRDCVHKGREAPGEPMWNAENALVLFVPGSPWTDPSYHLPHFYDLFALWAEPEDRPFWRRAAAASRSYLPAACDPRTGLSPEYAEFDGRPHRAPWDYGHHLFYSDSYRVAANIGLHHAWSGPDEALSGIASRIVAFFDAEDPADLRMYEPGGRRLEERALHPVALVAANAMAALALPRGEAADRAVLRLWETPLREGARRYYDNCLYFFALLALAGRYRIYPPAAAAVRSHARSMGDRPGYHNPILPGFYPDPSVCRVGEDYYLVNSTFAYFPGIPVHRSRDLVHWEQIGSALDRPSQLPLEGAGHSRGLFAPTIRHHDGKFYIVCTNVDHGGNFIVTAEDPAGPWSEPRWLEDAPGIDPSLFFDLDGRAWYCGTRPAPEGPKYDGNWEVWLRELDPSTLSLKGEALPLWRGALRDCIWPEGPHILRRGDWYYLTIAEGGTGPCHAVTVARSRALAGPWADNPANPILTHRHLGRDFPIVNVGHGDLFEDAAGDWWMVLLASRPYGGLYQNMGRETFLVPVAWEDDWPLPCPGSGRVEESFPLPRLPRFEAEPVPACDHFEDARLAPHWLSLRGPAGDFSSLAERPGYLRLRLRAPGMGDAAETSFVGRRQADMDWTARAELEFTPRAEGEAAGLVLLQSDDFHYRLELAHSPGGPVVRLIRAEGRDDRGAAVERTMAERPFEGGRIVLAAEARGQDLSFRYGPVGDTPRPGEDTPRPGALRLLAEGVDGRILSTERAGGFVGTTIGVFATGGGRDSGNVADFDWFEYRALQPREV